MLPICVVTSNHCDQAVAHQYKATQHKLFQSISCTVSAGNLPHIVYAIQLHCHVNLVCHADEQSRRSFELSSAPQGSPSSFTPTDKETYRRGSSVTTWRAGKDGKPYLYTLNLACPEERWAELGGLYHKAADSFRLTPPTKVRHPQRGCDSLASSV